MNWSVLAELDNRYTNRLRLKPGLPVWWRLASILAHSGDSWFWMAGLGLLWLSGYPKWHNWSAILAISVVVQAVSVLSLKFTIRRQRPPGDWGAVYRNTDPHSFPSGHATRAAMLALMVCLLGPSWLGWILLVWAPLVSAARVLVGVHYLSDVVAGFFIGIIIGLVMLQLQPFITTVVPFLFY